MDLHDAIKRLWLEQPEAMEAIVRRLERDLSGPIVPHRHAKIVGEVTSTVGTLRRLDYMRPVEDTPKNIREYLDTRERLEAAG